MKFGKNTIKIMAISAVVCFLLLMVAEAGVAIQILPRPGPIVIGCIYGIVYSVHIDEDTDYADSFVVKISSGQCTSISIPPQKQDSSLTTLLLEWKNNAGGDPNSDWKVGCQYFIPGNMLLSIYFIHLIIEPLPW